MLYYISRGFSKLREPDGLYEFVNRQNVKGVKTKDLNYRVKNEIANFTTTLSTSLKEIQFRTFWNSFTGESTLGK